MAVKEGIDPEVARHWAEEAERRYQEFLDGKVTAVPGKQALKRIRAVLAERSLGYRKDRI